MGIASRNEKIFSLEWVAIGWRLCNNEAIKQPQKGSEPVNILPDFTLTSKALAALKASLALKASEAPKPE